MDRGKGRGGKSSKPHFLGSGELIALGSKTTRPSVSSSDASSLDPRKQSSTSGTTSASSSKSLAGSSKLFSGGSSSSSSGSKSSALASDRKREGTSSSTNEHPAKKSRLHGASSSSTSGSSSTPAGSSKSSASAATSSSAHSLKPAKAIKRESLDSLNVKPEDLQPDIFFSEMEKADKHRDTDRAQNLILAAVKKIKANREKPDLRLCETLLMVSKEYPNFFHGSSIIETVSSMASSRKLGAAGAEAKLKLTQHNLPIFAPIAVNILANAHIKSSSWPTIFIQLWIEDATSDRFWVDTAHCKAIVDNVIYSFGTVLPNSSLLPPSDGGPGSQNPSGGSSPSLGLSDDSNILFEATQIMHDQKSELSVANRYSGKEAVIETVITDHALELLTKKAPDIPRNLIKALAQACGLSGVRAFVVSRLEQWLHNPKIGRNAQELLLTLAVNANCNTNADAEILTQISKLRMKTKPLMMFHAVAVREMVRDNEVNLKNVLNNVIYNELHPSQRHPNNLPILGSIVSGCPESRSVLAGIFLDLLTKREDFHSALRLLLREILRVCRFECDLTKFLKGLIRKNDLTWPSEFRERAFLAIADLIMLSMFLSVSPQVREASMVRGDSKDQTTLTNFRKLVGSMQSEAVSWLYTEVPKTFTPSKNVFMIALNKIILKDPANDLMVKDNWPPDSEKTLFSRLVLDVPVTESVVIWLSLMGLHKDYPVLPREVIDYIELLIVRAATHRSVLKFQKPEMYELLFRLSEYKHPDEIVLPEGYDPPKLAISKLYWQSWLILCVLAAHNPQGFGKLGWDQYPTLRMLMEMCMTNHFQFPTAACTENVDDLMSKEIQIAAMEKQEILEFETHLAAASSKQTINERNSLLLSQLMRLDPFGQPRNPPQQFLAQLQHLNVELHLGHLLCRSRSPDFLLDLIQKNSQPMPWLSQLVSEGSFDMLPIQCLCEFLLGQTEKLLKSKGNEFFKSEDLAPEKSPRKHGKNAPQTPDIPKDAKTLQLLNHLQNVVHKSTEPSDAREIIEYFLRRLASPKVQNRSQAIQGLQLLFAQPGKVEPVENWLMDCLPSLPIFSEVQGQVLVLLRQALQMETEPQLIFKYIEFLNVWGQMIDIEGSGLVLDIAQLLVERSVLTSIILGDDTTCYDPFFNIFLSYMKKIREPQKNEYRLSESEDVLLVRWNEEKLEATMNTQIIEAIIILIQAYSIVKAKTTKKEASGKTPIDLKFNELMDIWFPISKPNFPKGILLTTMEEIALFQPWLRLRMARSNNPRLLEAALQGLDVEQLLILFQSFGFPKQSMSALLYCLDAAVEQHPDSAKAHVKNPQYMQTLVEVHWKNGISGGKKFHQLLRQLTGLENTDVAKNQSSSRSTALRPQLNISSLKEQNRPKLKSSMQQSSNQLIRTPRNESFRSSVGSVISYESEVCDEEASRMKITNLSKQLYALSSPPSSRRRSSVPVDPNLSLEDPLSGSRRHSSHCDGGSTHVPMDVDVPGFGSANNLGELVDSITYIEPCIVRHAMDYQLPLLFGRSEVHPNCRSFLMTVLTHQAGWETVENLINLFLRDFDSAYDPASVLDLIAATNSNPKLWQGVDKYVPRHQPDISPFKLAEDQLLAMAEYIVEEISQLEMRSTKFSITNLLGPTQPTIPKSTKAVRNGLQERVKLWLQCCQQEKNVVDHVISNLMEKKGKNPCAKKMVSQVYLEFPEVIFVEKWASKAEELNFTEEEITCVLDTVSHSLITAIANTQPGKDWSKKASHEIEICLRKLAAVHPTLLQRQLPLMGTLLEGRVHLEFSAFHQQNHHIPFVVYLGLLDLMQPHVLKHFNFLKGPFTLYFKLFRNYGHMKDYSSSLSRFSVLLHNLLSANPKEVKEYLSPYYNTLRELSLVKYYVDVYPLQNLLSFLVPPSMVSDLCAATPAQVKNVGTDAHTSGFVSTLADRFLQASNHDEIIPILQDLEGFSTRNPAALYHFSDYLSPLLSSESDCCRNLAFSLIIKHVTYNPGSCNAYLESVLQALQSRNSHVRDTVLERIHEFVVLCQENGEEILMKIFDLGVTANINVLAALRKSLSLLRNYSCVS